MKKIHRGVIALILATIVSITPTTFAQTDPVDVGAVPVEEETNYTPLLGLLGLLGLMGLKRRHDSHDHVHTTTRP